MASVDRWLDIDVYDRDWVNDQVQAYLMSQQDIATAELLCKLEQVCLSVRLSSPQVGLWAKEPAQKRRGVDTNQEKHHFVYINQGICHCSQG